MLHQLWTSVYIYIDIDNMKIYQLSDDRTVVVKKNQGQLTVTIKQKDTDNPSSSHPTGNIPLSICLLAYITVN